jgi:hypothetical protein
MVRTIESNKFELISVFHCELDHAPLELIYSVVVVTTSENLPGSCKNFVLQQCYAPSSTQFEPLAFDYATGLVADPRAEDYEHCCDSIAVGLQERVREKFQVRQRKTAQVDEDAVWSARVKTGGCVSIGKDWCVLCGLDGLKLLGAASVRFE